MRIGNPTRNGLAFTLFPIHLPKPYTPYLGLTVGAREQQRSILSGRQFYRLDSKSWMYAQLRTLRARFSPLSETRVWTTLQLPVCLSVALRSMRSLAVSVFTNWEHFNLQHSFFTKEASGNSDKIESKEIKWNFICNESDSRTILWRTRSTEVHVGCEGSKCFKWAGKRSNSIFFFFMILF